MKKKNGLILSAAILCLTSNLFAGEPKSLTKQATAGLIEDGLVDDFDVGIDNVKGLWLGGFNVANNEFNFGYGAYNGAYWISVFDQGRFSYNANHTVSTKNDTVSADGVNIDYVDTEKQDTRTVGINNVDNKLYVSIAKEKVGVQAYWFTTDTTPAGSTLKDNTDSQQNATNTTTNTKNNSLRYVGTNTLGAYFNGFKTAETGNMNLYFQLDEAGLKLDSNINDATTSSNQKIGTVETIQNTKSVTNTNIITPYAKGSLGLTLPAFGNSVSKFTLGESLKVNIVAKKGTSSTTEIYEVPALATKTTTVTDVSSQYANTTNFENILTPKLTTTYNVGDSMKIKTCVAADITTTLKPTAGNTYVTTKTRETVLNQNTNTETVTITEESDIAGTLAQKQVEFKNVITPSIGLGFVYTVKPGKCDLMIGAQWAPGAITLTSTTKTNEEYNHTNKVTTIDATGKETVVSDTTNKVTADTNAAGDGTAETTVFQYSVAAPSSDRMWIGASFYFTENVKMDVIAKSSLTGFSLMGSNSLLESDLTVNFTVKF